MRTRPLRIGGLMRCCTGTIDAHDDREDENGTVVECEHCSSSMRLVDGVWEWNHD